MSRSKQDPQNKSEPEATTPQETPKATRKVTHAVATPEKVAASKPASPKPQKVVKLPNGVIIETY